MKWDVKIKDASIVIIFFVSVSVSNQQVVDVMKLLVNLRYDFIREAVCVNIEDDEWRWWGFGCLKQT